MSRYDRDHGWRRGWLGDLDDGRIQPDRGPRTRREGERSVSGREDWGTRPDELYDRDRYFSREDHPGDYRREGHGPGRGWRDEPERPQQRYQYDNYDRYFLGREEGTEFLGRDRDFAGAIHARDSRRTADYDRDFLGREVGYDRDYGHSHDHDRGYGREEELSFGQRIKRGWHRLIGDEGSSRVGRAPKNYQRSDERIREDICDWLIDQRWIDASDVEITVRSGEVTLLGTVDDRRTKRAIEDIAAGIRGVHDVHNQIRVRREPVGHTTSLTNDVTTTGTAAPALGPASAKVSTTTTAGTPPGTPGGTRRS